MNEMIETLFGHGKDLNSLQMVMRAIIAFFETLVLLQLAGIRTFGKKSAFDNVIVIMLGSILSRVVVGASPMVPTSLACLAFVLVHWVLGWLSYYSDTVGQWIKGSKSLLYDNGAENTKEMKKAQISRKDLLEAVRKELHDTDLHNVNQVYLERSGDLSIVKRQESKNRV